MTRRIRRLRSGARVVAISATVMGLVSAAELRGQEPPDSMPAAGQLAATEAPEPVSPGGAFLRSMIVPGWGQVVSGSYSRGAFYFLVEAASAYMIVKTNWFHGQSESRVAEREADARAAAARMGITNPDSLLAFVDADGAVEAARELRETRSQQLEDWIAFGVFMLFLGGADAFVSAHLADFPEPLTLRAAAVPGIDGPEPRVEVTVSWTWPGPRSARDR